MTITYDAASRVTSIVSGPTTVAFGYDDANRQIWEDQTLSGLLTRRVNTPVDVGKRNGGQCANLDTANFAYDSGGAIMFEFTYDKNGNLTKRQNIWLFASARFRAAEQVVRMGRDSAVQERRRI